MVTDIFAALWLLVAYPDELASLRCVSEAVWFEARHAVAEPLEQTEIAHAVMERTGGQPCLSRQDRGYPWRDKPLPEMRTEAMKAEWLQVVESSYLAMTGLVDRKFPGATHFDICTNRKGWQHKRHLVGVGGIGRTCFMKRGKWENAP